MDKYVSVIIPIYNAEKYLCKCLDSLIEQTLKKIEIIIINDGSTDSSGKICDEYSLKDERIRVIHKINEGVSRARNKGIEKAKGKYIMFVDSDDYVEKKWCEILYNLNEKNKNELIICGFNVINSRSTNIMQYNKCFDDSTLITEITKSEVYEISKKQLLNPIWNKIYVRDILIKNNIRFIEDISLGEDLLFNLDYLKYLNKGIKIYNKPLYNYELREHESLDNKYYDNLFEIYKILNKKLYFFMQENKVNIKKYERDYYTAYIFMIHRVFENTFHKKNNMSFFKKIKYNSQIMKSNEFKECLNKADLNIYAPQYIKILKTKIYLFVYIFERGMRLKDILKRTVNRR